MTWFAPKLTAQCRKQASLRCSQSGRPCTEPTGVSLSCLWPRQAQCGAPAQPKHSSKDQGTMPKVQDEQLGHDNTTWKKLAP